MEKSGAKIITSAEQLHQKKINASSGKTGVKRLYIDLDKCGSGECGRCEIKCSYWFHRQGPANNGIISVAELASYFIVCRRCEEPHCVNACPAGALEQQKERDNLLIRHNMRCISCRSCSYACPYGAIYPENLPHLIHNCDFCLDRRGEAAPLCISTCPYGALALLDEEEKVEENTYYTGDNILVHAARWKREKV